MLKNYTLLEQFWLNAADGFDPTPVPPSMTELLISQVEDVEVAFSEIYFSTSMYITSLGSFSRTDCRKHEEAIILNIYLTFLNQLDFDL